MTPITAISASMPRIRTRTIPRRPLPGLVVSWPAWSNLPWRIPYLVGWVEPTVLHASIGSVGFTHPTISQSLSVKSCRMVSVLTR